MAGDGLGAPWWTARIAEALVAGGKLAAEDVVARLIRQTHLVEAYACDRAAASAAARAPDGAELVAVAAALELRIDLNRARRPRVSPAKGTAS